MINRFAETCPRGLNMEHYQKAVNWLGIVRRGLQANAGTAATVDYLATLDLDTPPADRILPESEIDAAAEEFLSGMESMTWNGHALNALAELEDIRLDFKERTGHDIAVAQFESLRIVSGCL